MNIFNKTFLAIPLTLAIPLSTQANWFGDLTNTVLGKKKTIATGIVLGSALSYLALKLVDKLHENTGSYTLRSTDPSTWTYEDAASVTFVNEILNGLNKRGGRFIRAKKTNQKLGLAGALGLTAALMYLAHKKNWFGEKA